MTNPSNSGIGNALMQRKFQLNIQIQLSIINEYAVNNYYYMINSNTLPLESIVFIGISQYFLDQFDEFELYLRYLHYLKTYYNNNFILYTNNNPYAINNKENKLK